MHCTRTTATNGHATCSLRWRHCSGEYGNRQRDRDRGVARTRRQVSLDNQPDNLKCAAVDLRGRRKEKPRHAGGVLSESHGPSVRLTVARESESAKTDSEQCKGGRLG